ncbi:MAG TPA: PQQ-binding-like beta-propeller repeat protein, partial [Polyangiaceae bacterium]|nr:PQQ-binding-like beta-propeller repeat protein [Polyangiaceae bacterium]
MRAAASAVTALALALAGCTEQLPAKAPPLWSSRAPATDDGAWTMFHHDALHAGSSPHSPSHDPKLIWRFATGGQVWGAPAISRDSTVYVGSTDGRLYAIDGHTGQQRWEYQTFSGVWAGPSVGPDGTVYATSIDHHLYAIREGQLLWNVATGNCSFSSPTIGPDGTIFVGSNDRKLYAVSPEGKVRLALPTNGGIASSPTIGPDGTI